MIYIIILAWIVCGVVGWFFSGVHKHSHIDGDDFTLLGMAVILGPAAFVWVLIDKADNLKIKNPFYRERNSK